MRQHAIPQNILDVEFKLFTKFTVKEFVYLVTGVTVGAIFIYLWTEGTLPGVLAFPIFLFFSSIGLILGLVPINDQPADQFIKNYITAINTPTQRVWQNAEFKEKIMIKKKEFVEDTKPQTPIDIEEEKKLEKLDVLFEETGLKPKEEVKKDIVIQNKNVIKINDENVYQFVLPNINPKLIGTINLILESQQKQPVVDASVIVKDGTGKPLFAIKPGKRGEALMSRTLPQGKYIIDVKSDSLTFPIIEWDVTQEVYPVIKLTSI